MRFVKRTYGDGRVAYVALDGQGCELRRFDTKAELLEYKANQEALQRAWTYTDEDVTL